jgi:FkbM family methyltransferase
MKKILLLFIPTIFVFASSTYDDLISKGLLSEDEKPKLHLGCGETRLEGYINIDFPMENRTLHKINTADYFHDVTTLKFPNNSVRAVESHHIFEHFSRPESLAMLVAWHMWLDNSGELVIETPDFNKAIKRYLKSSSKKSQETILRHIFGSQEAGWALHKDGWSAKKFTLFLEALGYEIQKIDHISWNIIDNVTIKAIKKDQKSLKELKATAKDLLKLSMVDESESEILMCEGWYNQFETALNKMLSNTTPENLIPKNALIFDVGAHKGVKTDSYLMLDPALIIAIEPQPNCVNILHQKFDLNRKVKIIPSCLSDEEGVIELNICEEAPTISTCADHWKNGRFKNFTWGSKITVPTTTLDNLIQKFGKPFFCKIDVEGFELSVLKGLSEPLPLISFEYTREFFKNTIDCIEFLKSLGMTKFNFTKGENLEFVLDEWADASKLAEKISQESESDLWGDIYAICPDLIEI